MKSKMKNCYDYRSLPVAEELKKWKIPDSEIQKELEALARDHSGEQKIQGPAGEGDSLRLSCLESSEEGWKDREILLFPGRKLPGAEEAEEAVLGKHTGDTVECRIKGAKLSMRIEEILRRRVMSVGEELMAELNLPGVSTVEDYYRWYHREHDPKAREKAWIKIVQYWLTEIAANSDFLIDEEERQQWCCHKSRVMYQAMLAAGVDLRKPTEERPRELTEEEAVAEGAKEQEIRFQPYVIYRYFCEKDGYEVTEEMYCQEVRKIAKERGMEEAEAFAQSDFQVYEEVKYQEHAFHFLGRDAEKLLED